MPTRLPSLRQPPIGFAHRGARAHAPENTLEAFELALRLGATGLETDAWVTADGVAVLHHDGVVGRRLRRRRIGDVPRAELPDHIPTLDELYDRCGTAVDLSIDIKDPAAFDPVIEATAARGVEAQGRLWLCHPDLDLLTTWRDRSPHVRLVHSTRRKHLGGSPEQHAARLQASGIDAVNLHRSEWTGGLVTLYHRFDRYALGWDAQFVRTIAELLDAGIDGVFSDHVDLLVDCLARIGD